MPTLDVNSLSKDSLVRGTKVRLIFASVSIPSLPSTLSCCAYSGLQPLLEVGISSIIKHDCANGLVKYREHEVGSHAVQCLKR